LVLVEAVHLGKHLVQGLLALVIAAAKSRATMPPYRVDLVNEDNRGLCGFGTVEQVTHATRANTDEHLHKLGCRDTEEGDICLACYCTCQQGFTRSGRSDQQHAARNTSAKGDILIRLFQEVHDFDQFTLCRVLPRNVRERDLWTLSVVFPRLRTSEAKHAAHLPLRTTHRPDQETE